MPLLDLSLVTATLQNIVERRVRAGLTALGQPATVLANLSVSALPPDALTGDVTVGLYLYHAIEDPNLKNLPPISQDTPPVRFTPMSLNLFYQLTAHSAAPGEAGAAMIQRLFGLAVKALRDFPMVDRSTIVEALPAFPVELQGTDNRFRIVLQATPAAEATQYWTGTQAIRLAAYYQVSAVLLEPESPSRYGGRVLRYGIQTFVSGAPRLDSSRSLVVFRVPGESTDRQAEVQPAEAAIGAPFTLQGSDLAGDETTLLLKHPTFTAPLEVGLDWGVSATNTQIFASAHAFADTTTLLPGFYTVMAKVTRRKKMPDGSLRAFSQTSNEVAFTLATAVTTPNATTVAIADVNGIVVVQGHLFLHPDLDNADVKVIVGPGEIPRETSGALTAGHFEVVNGTTVVPPVVLDEPTRPFIIRFRFPIAGVDSGTVVPLRIRIRGAENAPRWVEAP